MGNVCGRQSDKKDGGISPEKMAGGLRKTSPKAESPKPEPVKEVKKKEIPKSFDLPVDSKKKPLVKSASAQVKDS